jgi:hypothetical protein
MQGMLEHAEQTGPLYSNASAEAALSMVRFKSSSSMFV